MDKIESLRPYVVFACMETADLPSLAAFDRRGFSKRPYVVVLSGSERHAMEALATP